MTISSKLKKYSNITSYKIDADEVDYLYISKSQIPDSGNGLYTAISIYKDEVISLFKGEILTTIEASARAEHGDDEYFMKLPDGTILDAMHTECFAKFANDALGLVQSNYKINSTISLNETGNVCIIAKKKINAGEEIFCRYGNAYWKRNKK